MRLRWPFKFLSRNKERAGALAKGNQTTYRSAGDHSRGPLNGGEELPPPPPRELIAGREVYEIPLLNRTLERDGDSPLAALYRIYEHIVLDQHIEIRNEIEYFWYHSDWAVRDIPDPRDPDPERYALLACIPALLCLAFNERIDLGLPRNAPPIFTRDMLDEWRAQERPLEEEPAWTDRVPPVDRTLHIPHWDNSVRDFVTLESFDDPRASSECAKKNILIWQPHIHFA